MNIEHVGYQVADAVATSKWYCEHLGFTVKRSSDGLSNTHFLADGSGQVMIEIYNNPTLDVPDYASMNPLLFHLAFSCEDIEEREAALLAAGATVAEPLKVTSAGDKLLMLRDPWGMAIQLCKREKSMV